MIEGGNVLTHLAHTQENDAGRKYEILRTVNRGGMGEIAMARVRGTKGFEKLVVLKRLRADAEREDHVAMFDVEQEVMSRIEHPNIVKVFDQPVIQGVPYLAMEYVRGRNLDQLIRASDQQDEQLGLQFALTLIAEVLRGLAFVHRLKDSEGRALGVVHQDMTPSNVMLSFFGEVKITDFGISYVTSRDGGLRKGVLKGKPRYVAPEVLAGKRVNNRADIYGVGTILFELLKGKALFARASVKETLGAVARNELPDFGQEFPQHGPGLRKLFERSLAKDPQDRYRTAEEMAAELLRELSSLGGPIAPASLGLFLRKLFRDDPDIPEMDPELEQALLAGEVEPHQALKPKDLDATLEELDRLLGNGSGASGGLDVFDVNLLPPEVTRELSGMSDNDPFMALTPIPDFVWDAKDDEDLLRRAQATFRQGPSLVERVPAEPSGQSPEAPAPRAVQDGASEAETEPQRAGGASPAGAYSMVRARDSESEEVTSAMPSQSPFWVGMALGGLAGAAAGAVGTAFLAGLLG
ncbi:MAG: serine/threonine protein kinase [Myxococcota bacterium]